MLISWVLFSTPCYIALMYISAMGTLDDYLCYTQKVMEYAGQFPWKRVLKYDQAFRHKQANGQLRWRDDNQHLVTVHLVSTVHKGTPSKPQQNRGARQPAQQSSVPICHMYNQQAGCTLACPCGSYPEDNTDTIEGGEEMLDAPREEHVLSGSNHNVLFSINS